ncbi:MAG: metallophosphoesterase [Terriglobia bacterium]|nr:metallophosphoesterase [Terriglobia bacterium]
MLFIIFLLIWGLMHWYVLVRLSSVPGIAGHLPTWALVLGGVLLGSSYIVSRVMERFGLDSFSHALEYIGANWVGVIFILLISFLAADIVTGFGSLFVSWVPATRAVALAAAILLIAISVIQAVRAPVVTNYEVRMQGLPKAADGTVLVVASDMHLGPMIDERWATARASQIASLRPDLLLLVGDICEAPKDTHDQWLPTLQQFKAPKGVFLVTGNHEFYAGAGPLVDLFGRAGFRVLHDEHVEPLPGLTVAGVDDVAFRRRGSEDAPQAVDRALAGRASGATLFLSHTPVYADQAAKAGAGLMLSGHTHNGQIWPFKYLVRLAFPLLTGRYNVNGMTVIVGRGTGSWGPRMRLWQRGELLRIVLRAA